MPAFNPLHIEQQNFVALFNELGWDNPAQQQPYTVIAKNQSFELKSVAVKRGVQVLHVQPNAQGNTPDYATRQTIERKITKDVREHLIVYTNRAKTVQIWQWVSRSAGKPTQYRELRVAKGETPELLKQKLERLAFTLEEENLLNVLSVARRLDDAVPRDKVTKKFYTEFEKQRKAFGAFIHGIPTSSEDNRWYTAVLVDRLMFLWFLQEKGFLNHEKNYLQNRLSFHLEAVSSAGAGASTHETFYKQFLVPLFFRGFAEPRTDSNRADIEAQFGDIPYLNGGLFAEHKIERSYAGLLDVDDAAFVALFAFFDQWEWHLDERPLKNGKEINPDVLGYIFEKFVNQKQMGAYYTKEDITEYIGKNTIIPSLLATVQAQHPEAFADHAWAMLQHSGDDYIYPSVLKGIKHLVPNDAFNYPAHIALGIDAEAPDLIARRAQWNTRASDAASLPTETWRETIARHQRAQALRQTIASGELQNISDLITHNLNIRQFAQDFIERCTDIKLLHSVWVTLAGQLPHVGNPVLKHGITVLDPTCGSGAFLFAALNILKPLYDAALRTLHALRMDALLAQGNQLKASDSATWAQIDATLARFAANAGTERAQDYQVIKHIIVHNLYGVDIEEQATEIAKLRLFLKLVALLEPGDNIEPLPDIDFNIRHGNTLVGYATAAEAELAVRGKIGDSNIAGQGLLGLNDRWDAIAQSLQAVQQQYNAFQLRQVQRGGHIDRADKDDLERALSDLNEQLDYHLGKEYGVSEGDVAGHAVWKFDHQPFHWVVDFYPIMARGGFDVVIGNPPYIPAAKVRTKYQVKNYQTADASDIYAWCLERVIKISNSYAVNGMIIPMSLCFSDSFDSLRKVFYGDYIGNYFASFGKRPSLLFSGVQIRCTIHIGIKKLEKSVTQTTIAHRWYEDFREHLFSSINFSSFNQKKWDGLIPKISSEKLVKVFEKKLSIQNENITNEYSKNTPHKIFYKKSGYNWLAFSKQIPPCFNSDGIEIEQNEYGVISFKNSNLVDMAYLLLNGKWQFVFWVIRGDDFHLTKWNFETLPFDLQILTAEQIALLLPLAQKLKQRMDEELVFMTMHGKRLGSYNLSKCRDVTDQSDLIFAEAFGLLDVWEDIELMYVQAVKAAGISSDD